MRSRVLLSSFALAVVAAASAAPAAEKEKKPELALEGDGIARRSFSLTTDEVTWLSVDVAPAGDRLVLEVLGDLYTLPIAGGRAERLTSGMAFDSQPAWSPDGEHVAFLSDRDGAENVWILPVAGGEPKKLSQEKKADFASPTWTPDGDYVIASRSTWGLRTFELWMYHTEGGKGVQITEAKQPAEGPGPAAPGPRHNALGADVSADGRFLYYAQRRGGFQYNAALPLWQIARRDLVTGDEDRLTSAAGSAFRPRLSPDDRWLVYATRHDDQTGLKVRELATGEERWLAFPVQRDDQESRFTRDLYPGYAFLPDGSEIVVTWNGRLHRVAIADGSSREIPFEIPIELELGPRLHFPQQLDDGPVRARLVQGAELDPGATTVAFSALERVYLQDLAGGPPRPLSPEGTKAFQPTWSPDGSSVVYVTWDTEGGHIEKIPATGGVAERLTEVPAYYSDPVVSPAGDRVVALRASRQARLEMPSEFGPSGLVYDLVSVPADGGGVSLIAPARGRGAPHFGPESDRVYLYSQEGLLSMRFDGTDRRSHLQVKGPGLYFAEEPVPASEVRISPDGAWALAFVSNRFYLTAVPRRGGEAPVVDLSAPGVPLRKLTPIGADRFGWADGGRTITWTVGADFFRLDLAAVSFEPPEDAEEEAEDAEDGEDEDEATPKPEAFPEAETLPLLVEVPRHAPRGTLALVGARVVHLAGGALDGAVVDDGVVLIENDRIVAVGPRAEVEVPAGADRLDAAGTTIVPGFVDTHAHWTEIRRGVLETPSWPFLANLAWGVTTGLDVQTGTP
ncbi:MAG: amidohydrolase, partial [Thermoanaerobaculia bacterium]|nr:amidohydrolase [Thermoanaerobaculia bacterium]